MERTPNHTRLEPSSPDTPRSRWFGGVPPPAGPPPKKDRQSASKPIGSPAAEAPAGAGSPPASRAPGQTEDATPPTQPGSAGPPSPLATWARTNLALASAPAPARSPAALAPGRVVFERFELNQLLGRGGMGLVYKAHDLKLDRPVAMKFLSDLVCMDVTAIDDLKRETRRGLELTHSNMVRVYDFIEGDEGAAITMEYVDGRNLAQLRVSRPSRVFESGELRPLVWQWLDAIAYAHAMDVVHRDIKPGNLMLTSAGFLKVGDFGIARCLSESLSRQTSLTTASGGTLAYMSPQQAFGELPKPADDIYSIGATLYELFTGKPPFYGGDISRQLQEKLPPSMTRRRRELGIESQAPIPEMWELAVAACLAKDPCRRPADVHQLAGMLGMELRPWMPGGKLAPTVERTARVTVKAEPEVVPDSGQAADTALAPPAEAAAAETTGSAPDRARTDWVIGIALAALGLALAGLVWWIMPRPDAGRSSNAALGGPGGDAGNPVVRDPATAAAPTERPAAVLEDPDPGPYTVPPPADQATPPHDGRQPDSAVIIGPRMESGQTVREPALPPWQQPQGPRATLAESAAHDWPGLSTDWLYPERGPEPLAALLVPPPRPATGANSGLHPWTGPSVQAADAFALPAPEAAAEAPGRPTPGNGGSVATARDRPLDADLWELLGRADIGAAVKVAALEAHLEQYGEVGEVNGHHPAGTEASLAEQLPYWREAAERESPDQPWDIAGLFAGTTYSEYTEAGRRRILAAAQGKLTELGLYNRAIDGLEGQGTHHSLIEFQRQRGLVASGRLSTPTLIELGLDQEGDDASFQAAHRPAQRVTAADRQQSGRQQSPGGADTPRWALPPPPGPPGDNEDYSWFRRTFFSESIPGR